MTDAREIISNAIAQARDMDHPNWISFILQRLTAAGFRILGPDEVDQVTVEKCAAELEKPRKFIDGTEVALPSALACAAAIRALASGESR